MEYFGIDEKILYSNSSILEDNATVSVEILILLIYNLNI